ncbi:Actin-like protein arp6 [Porphyridium purpureum]|uniref:Actin-like protein arp6 n=1 Tax=Porphyridium purpureum TaxID=35688 RepID=A0A5J4Z349_PORPP|nr:Actin-like protein arp6 [Porphyridium purpureum]|eukprot:POR7971..scf208_2
MAPSRDSLAASPAATPCDSASLSSSIVFLDNGAGDIKCARVPSDHFSAEDIREAVGAAVRIPNAACRPRVEVPGVPRRAGNVMYGSELRSCRDFSEMSFSRPHQRGYVCSWGLELDIWSHLLNNEQAVDAQGTHRNAIITTAPCFNPGHMIHAESELVFEYLGFQRYVQLTSQAMPAFAASTSSHACVVLDTGFSFSHAVPVIDGRVIWRAVRRLDLGGKALTNQLKEIISFRAYNMMRDTAVVNAIKERVCRVSPHYLAEIALENKKPRSRRYTPTPDYMLPDATTGYKDPLGFVIDPANVPTLDPTAQTLALTNEKIFIPELLFSPSDIGLGQAGVAELVCQAVEACSAHLPPDEAMRLRALLYGNVQVVGGNSLFPGFVKRLLADMRPLVPAEIKLQVLRAPDPQLAALEGSMFFTQQWMESGRPLFVSKAEYDEFGPNVCYSRFQSLA